MWYMLNYTKKEQIQKYKTHAYYNLKTAKTAHVQTIVLKVKHPTKL